MAIDLNAYRQKARQIQQDKALDAKQISQKAADQQTISQFKTNDKPTISTGNSVIPNFKSTPKPAETPTEKPALSFANTFKKAAQDFKRSREISLDQLEDDLENATTEQQIQAVEADFRKLLVAVKEKLHKKLQGPRDALQALLQHPIYKHYQFALEFTKDFEEARKQYMSEIQNPDLKSLYAQINSRDSGIVMERKLEEFKNKKDKFSQKMNLLFQSLNEKENNPENQRSFVNYENTKKYFMKNYPEMAFIFDIIPDNIMELDKAERGEILERAYIEAAKRSNEIGLGLNPSDNFLLEQLETYIGTKKDIDEYPNKQVRWRKDPTEDSRKGRKEEIPVLAQEIEKYKTAENNIKIEFINGIKPILNDFSRKIARKKAQIKDSNTLAANIPTESR